MVVVLNSPHINEDFSAEDWIDCLLEWNEQFNFDGFDFDLEGNDDYNCKYNIFSFKQLYLIGSLASLMRKIIL